MEPISVRRIVYALQFLCVTFQVPLSHVLAQQVHSSSADRSRISRIASTVTLTTSNARPLHQAVLTLSEEYGLTIDYEDPPYKSSEISEYDEAALQKYHIRPHTKMINTHSFASQFMESFDSNRKALNGGDILDRVLSAYRSSVNPGVFHLLTENDGDFAIVGQVDGSDQEQVQKELGVLDTPISLARSTRTLKDTIDAILGEVTAKRGIAIILGSYPLDIVNKSYVKIAGDNVSARDLVRNSLNATGRAMRWFLLYDPTFNRFVLNIRPVMRATYDSAGNRHLAPVDLALP